MIRWTAAGAVAEAVTVQIRINRHFTGRMGAGAPEPSRDLSAPEVLENVEYYTQGRRGPRTVPCSGLVLSGSGLLARGDLSEIIEGARGLGIERVVLHGGLDEVEGLAASSLADELVVSALTPADLERLGSLQPGEACLSLALGLTRAVIERFAETVEAVRDGPFARLVLTWPFGGASSPPPATEVIHALESAMEQLATLPLPWGVKNLPLCQFGERALGAERIWRSGNRWYVDADHQCSEALLFFPDVLRFYKADSCRYCKWDLQCDGVFERWYREGLTKPLQPI